MMNRPELIDLDYSGDTSIFGEKYMEVIIGPGTTAAMHRTRSNNKLFNALNAGFREESGSRAAGWIWGHLLNAELGGDASDRNQTLLTATGNGNSANQKHSSIESKVKNAVRAGELASRAYKNHDYWLCVYYKVEVKKNNSRLDSELYQLSKQIPYGLKVNAYPMLVSKMDLSDRTPLKFGLRKNRAILDRLCPGISRATQDYYLDCYTSNELIRNFIDNLNQVLLPSDLGTGTNSAPGGARVVRGIRKQKKTKRKQAPGSYTYVPGYPRTARKKRQ